MPVGVGVTVVVVVMVGLGEPGLTDGVGVDTEPAGLIPVRCTTRFPRYQGQADAGWAGSRWNCSHAL